MCKWGTDVEVKLCRPRKHSGLTTAKVDACIAPLVQMLNDYGIQTEGCCCGHGKKGTETSIMIHFRHLIFDSVQFSDGEETARVKIQFPYPKEDHDETKD